MSRESRPISILYFGDFDPSGEDIYRDIEERLTNDFQIDASFKKVSLTTEDIERYKLPPNPTKIGDTRTAKFVAKHGDVAVELDALRPDILREHVEAAILSKIDKKVWEKELEKEKRDKTQINSLIESLKI